MTVLIVIGWLLCAAFSLWRWADDFGHITLFTAVIHIIFAPFAAIAGLLVNPPRILRINLNPVLWRKR